MWGRPAWVRAAVIGVAAGCAFHGAGCAFHANQAVPGDGPDTCTTGHPYICECDGHAADPDNYMP